MQFSRVIWIENKALCVVKGRMFTYKQTILLFSVLVLAQMAFSVRFTF